MSAWFKHGEILVLAEKPSQLKALKLALSGQNNIQFQALSGHCLKLADLAEYGSEFDCSWLELVQRSLVPFIPREFHRIPISSKGSRAKEIIQQLSKVIPKVDCIVLACDPDNEGMALGVELIVHLGGENKIIGALNTSKLDPQSMAVAVQDIHSIPWRAMANAGLSRAEYDWSLGINGTILASVLLGQGETWHIGGVKLPALRCVVDREKAIRDFVPEIYYTLTGQARHLESGMDFEFEVKVDKHAQLSKRTAELVQKHLLEKPGAIVTEYFEVLNAEQPPPKPFSLADLQAEASVKLSKNPGTTLRTAQSLYEQGFLSYPRTDCRFYAYGQKKEVPAILDALRKRSPFSKHQFSKPYQASTSIFQDGKVTAHTALSVTSKSLPTSGIDKQQEGIYNLVAVRYAIQFMNKCKYNSYALLCEPIEPLKAAKINLFSTENISTDLGWKALYPEHCGIATKERRSLPEARQGDRIRVLSLELKEHQTQPPPRFTEASLIKAMEKISSMYPELKGTLKNGIGTPATRTNIIEDLLHNGYLEHNGRSLRPMDLAFKLIDTLPESGTSALKRARLESQLQAITEGQLNTSQFKKEFKSEIEQFSREVMSIAKAQNFTPSSKKRRQGPSVKQVSFANSIAKRLKQSIPEDIKKSGPLLSEWISEHKDSQPPQQKSLFSEKQRKIVLSNCKDPKILKLLDSADRSAYEPVSQWIGEFFKNSKSKKASHKQEEIIVELAP